MKIGAVALLVVADKGDVTFAELGGLLLVVVLHRRDDVLEDCVELVDRLRAAGGDLFCDVREAPCYRNSAVWTERQFRIEPTRRLHVQRFRQDSDLFARDFETYG